MLRALLDDLSRRHGPVTLAELGRATGLATEEVRGLLELLVAQGRLVRIDPAACALPPAACGACTL
ncbi:MAG: helix-turn-helix domain-containing protein, partial [Actinobacteria bacterium]|nr:helix-turn-helix domain-containing protein [Actinomycetota bacterium]